MDVKDLLKLARYNARHEKIVQRRIDKDEKRANNVLYRHRTRLGLTIDELAMNCKMSPTTIRKIERGQVDNIRSTSLIKLARYFRFKKWTVFA